MYKAYFLIFMFVLGAIFGSFACCTARRLHAREIGSKIDSKWSICEHCKNRLKWSENLPILSWLFLRGRCKKCHKKIGLAELLSELGLALAFLALGFQFWPTLISANSPLPFLELALLMATFILFTICFIYDALWHSFPSLILYLLLTFAASSLALNFATKPVFTTFTLYPTPKSLSLPGFLASLGILPGLYYLLYLFSKETLVGSGDWLLCLAIAFLLHDFWLSFAVLFLSNFLAVLVNLPLALAKKQKHYQFPFGPFLIIAFLIVYFTASFFM